jgi:ribulose-5-phosphate 4-epimerase/fuculose-1-phosphate aldolase
LPIHDIREFDPRETLIRTPALGRSLALVLADKTGVLLKGHGIALTGSSVPAVVQRADDLRMNAQVQQQALALRGQVTYLDQPQSVRLALGNRAWEYWKELTVVRYPRLKARAYGSTEVD